MTFSINFLDFNEYKIPILYPDPINNISVQVISEIKKNLLPENVTLIQTKPGQAFFAQIHVSMILSIILGIPFIMREFAKFIGPGLYQKEEVIIKKIVVPSVVLFILGCLFSYFIVIPHTIEFLYKYGESIGVVTFFDISEFISFIMQFLITFGFSYQLPLLMWAITISGVVNTTFWKHNIRYFIIIIIIFSAIITPDGSGITMWFVAGPMIFIYIIGIIVIDRSVKLS
jgi:sec-independent protein translocase protein TatC